jgi:hypothetical protein
MRIVSVSQMRSFRSCHRAHYFEYTLGVRPVAEAETLRFGSLFHVGLGAWWSIGNPDIRLEPALLEMRSRAQGSDEFELAKAEALLSGYHCRWKDEPIETISVEQEFATPLINPATGAASRTWVLGGKLDALARQPSVCVVEHKTSSEEIGAGSDYWKRLRLDAQVSIYFDGARALGYLADECLYDVVRKPMLRPGIVPLIDENGIKIVHDFAGARVRTKDGKKWRETGDSAQGYVLQSRPETPEEYRDRLCTEIAGNPDRYFQRGTVVRLEEEMRDAQYDTWQTARLIREAEIANRWPRNPDACIRYGRTCRFFDVCTGAASIDDPTLFRKVVRTHEELSSQPHNTTPKEEEQTCNL